MDDLENIEKPPSLTPERAKTELAGYGCVRLDMTSAHELHDISKKPAFNL